MEGDAEYACLIDSGDAAGPILLYIFGLLDNYWKFFLLMHELGIYFQ